MKTTTLGAALGSAALLFSAEICGATHGHRQAHSHYEKRHTHGHLHDLFHEPEKRDEDATLVKKTVLCSLPDHPDLVSITSGQQNKGFAMSPDQPCKAGMYCPIACKSGKVMAQWQPNSTFVYPQSMNGGLYCDDGKPTKPFPDAPYCVDGTGTVTAVNKCGSVVSFCQTVLPGNEAMLIPTDVIDTATLAVPASTYWDGTAAHYYINGPGVPSSEGCIWGSDAKPIGNWSPYVAGANTDSSGQTFVKIGWNPIYQASKWATVKPSWGVKIECNGNCNGIPCEIDPSKTGIGGVTSANQATGAGGSSFCVVTIAKGSTANIVVFNTDGSTGTVSSSSSSPPAPTSTSTSSTQAPSTSSTSISKPTSTSTSQQDEGSSSSSSSAAPSVRSGVFHENGTHSSSSSYTEPKPSTTLSGPSSGTTSNSSPSATESKNDGANRDQGGAAVVGLIVALVAAAWLY